jgi:VanZ family protein
LTPESHRGTGEPFPGSRWSAVLAVLTVGFAAYGSFVPLHLAPRPREEAWFVFRHALPIRVSPSDLLVNVLLMAPFPFFFLGAFPSSRDRLARVAPAAGAWILSVLLSAAVEFGQTFFPPRHPSLVDIGAQAAGAAGAALLWIAAGPELLSSWKRWRTRYGPAKPGEWILWPYVAAIFLGRLSPFDFTANSGLLRAKWQAGRIVITPFVRVLEDPERQALQAAAGAAMWIPVAALLVLSRRASPVRAFLLTAALAGCLEVARLLVISRVSDLTDLVTAVVGAAIGAALGSIARPLGAREPLEGDGPGTERQGASERSPSLAQPESGRPSKTASAESE